jgi:hypothetical protein
LPSGAACRTNSTMRWARASATRSVRCPSGRAMSIRQRLVRSTRVATAVVPLPKKRLPSQCPCTAWSWGALAQFVSASIGCVRPRARVRALDRKPEHGNTLPVAASARDDRMPTAHCPLLTGPPHRTREAARTRASAAIGFWATAVEVRAGPVGSGLAMQVTSLRVLHEDPASFCERRAHDQFRSRHRWVLLRCRLQCLHRRE